MISKTYRPDDYPLPLTPEQEQYLIDQSALENMMRTPRYGKYAERTAEQREGEWREQMAWERIAPIPDHT